MTTTVNMYSACYNELDAIFTELEDFFCQSKQKVLDQVRGLLQKKGESNNNFVKVQEKVQEMKKMSEYIKYISNYFVNGDIPNLK